MKQKNFFRFNDFQFITVLVLTLSSCGAADPDALIISSLGHPNDGV